MRPVNKWNPGSVTLPDGTQIQVDSNYPDYKNAKPILSVNLGCMCSYCEKIYPDDRDLHVEHIQPKNYVDEHNNKIYAHLETAWQNFLLSCATCNGADNKGTKNVEYGKCHLPHLNNTFLSLVYKPGGVVEVNPLLKGVSCDNATSLLNLIGLNKGPKVSKERDKRWEVRSKVWKLANRYLQKFSKREIDMETLIDLVKGYGCWSIWFTVFREYDEVRKALIEEFPGTAVECFDAQHHYDPVCRNPENTIDPV